MREHPRIIISPGVEALDLRKAQNEIRARYGRAYHVNEHCLRDVAALWGIGPEHDCINDAGVFMPYQSIDLRAGRCSAEIRYAASPSGLWAMDTSHMTATSGNGSSPSIWNRVAFESEDDARAAGLYALIELFRHIAASGRPEAGEASKLVALLEDERTPQLALF
ncbi:hypothetical protein [Filomicrobium sp.]|uniref:hypothetical protein n=1 Tax=Filomicrobium sp. TaxID=2024831 RepID=UPI00258F253E|nr:hypothetical protein [Filomicrobium sp.]MCV0370221.1 hypothetical protein [Filomicrobium sp.]